MASTTTAPPVGTEPQARTTRTRTRIAIAAFGLLVALAGIEHGIGEMLQGPTVPDGLLIESWADSPAFDILNGEPAMTIVPNLLITGILAVLASTAFGVTAIMATRWRHGGWLLIGLSVLMLLFGGGLAPPLIGVILAIATARATTQRARPPGRIGRTIAPLWSTFTAVSIAGYLALMPGTVVLAELADIESATLVVMFASLAFAGLLLALPAALAADRLNAKAAPAHRHDLMTVVG